MPLNTRILSYVTAYMPCKCNHESFRHHEDGCHYPACDCKIAYKTIIGANTALKAGLTNWLNSRRPDPLKDPPWYAHVLILAPVALIIISGVLLGLMSAFVVEWSIQTFSDFAIVLIIVNLAGVVLLYLFSAATITNLRSKLRDHERRLKSLENGRWQGHGES